MPTIPPLDQQQLFELVWLAARANPEHETFVDFAAAVDDEHPVHQHFAALSQIARLLRSFPYSGALLGRPELDARPQSIADYLAALLQQQLDASRHVDDELHELAQLRADRDALRRLLGISPVLCP